MSTRRRSAGIVVLIVIAAIRCTGRRAETAAPVWLSRPEVARAEIPPADSMVADIYVDATLSMTGFVTDPDSAYVRLLDELEGSLANKWKKSADLRYYKFGKSVRQVDRTEFRQARTPAFYNERGIYETTDIDLVAARATPKRLSVAVTDLFQRDQDMNPIVSSIRRNVFEKELAVGILAVNSEFDGKVYDARTAPYRYASRKGAGGTYRPFYLLLFGDAAAIEELVNALAQRPFIDRSKFLLISPHIVRKYQVSAAKRAGSKSLKARAGGGEADEFMFDVRKNGRGGVIDAEIRIEPNPHAADFKPEAIEIIARQTAPSGSETRDVSLQSVTRTGDLLKASLLLDIAAAEGKYSYDVLFRTRGPGALNVPKWIDELSSENPTPEKEANRTLNLKRFVTELIDASASIHRPALAKLRLNVRKLG
ncbi:MAG TPA: hypothetical protein VEK57_00275 [Thermoanaerobaculia bacterium]|nr:hypothetical protein [Thermoanaerobaculia bacterium]